MDDRHNGSMVFFVALASAFLALSALTALRPGRRGLSAIVAYPVGWAAGELPAQAIVVQFALVGLLWWWGWPRTQWLGLVVVILALVVVVQNLTLIAIALRSRTVVRRAMRDAPLRPLEIGAPSDDVFGSWWRTALQFPFHPRSMQLIKNVVYGPERRHRLDIWRTSTTPSNAPVVFYIHGGSWTFGDKREQGRPMLHEFVARGWIAVVINYRLAPKFTWPAQIEDATRALGWIKKNIAVHGGDPDRVVVAGGSAGGHLAALVALTAKDATWRPSDLEGVDDWSVRGAMSFYGVLEMTGNDRHWRGMGRGLLHLLENVVVKVPLLDNEDLYRAISPYERIGEDAPPFMVVHGSNDTLVDVNVAREFVERFRAVSPSPIYYVELPFAQHAFDLTSSPRTSATTRAAVVFATTVATVRPPLSDELIRSYQVPPTVLEVELAVDDWVDARTAASRLGPFSVVTSDNPYSEPLDQIENEHRRVAMARDLDRRGVRTLRTRACDPSGEWPSEEGLALFDVTSDFARGVARTWEQFALYDVREEVVVRSVASGEVLSSSRRA